MYQTGCFFVRQSAESVRTMFPVPQFWLIQNDVYMHVLIETFLLWMDSVIIVVEIIVKGS